MINIPGGTCSDLCDANMKLTRRDLLRIGGSSILGLSLGSMFKLNAMAKETSLGGGPGWGKAKNMIMIYLQGGPSHLDLWDPKENVPDVVRSVLKGQPTKLHGVHVTELLPKTGH